MKASKPISKDNVPTATLHSGLSNSKTTTEPTTRVPIHTHQATNSALPKLMNINILGCIGDGEHCTSCTGGQYWALAKAQYTSRSR